MPRSLKNPSERAFVEWAKSQGWEVTKRGWPDFFCQNAKGIMGVEVKQHGYSSLAPAQWKVMEALQAYGVPVFKWDPEAGLTPIAQVYKRATRSRGTTPSFPNDDSLREML